MSRHPFSAAPFTAAQEARIREIVREAIDADRAAQVAQQRKAIP